MTSNRQRLMILSDHSLLARVIQVNLGDEWEVNTRILTEDDPLEIVPAEADPSLIIIGQSASGGEPLVSLFGASLIQAIGQIPILIISERAFISRPRALIWHLDYPFTGVELQQTVKSILLGVSRRAAPTQAQTNHSAPPHSL